MTVQMAQEARALAAKPEDVGSVPDEILLSWPLTATYVLL